jgi:eukaryotic-like serine/threonine-protein kinase
MRKGAWVHVSRLDHSCRGYQISVQVGGNLLPPRYARAQKIATGGMGEIYQAEDETLGRAVAIKLLAERYSRDEAIRRRFTREALAAAKLSGHPHIVTIFDVGESEGGRPFIVMEYLPGGTLA